MEKTKAQLKKELEATKKDMKCVNEQLADCQGRNRGLVNVIEKAKTGWAIGVKEQTVHGSYSDLKAVAKLLIDNGLWFFELRKD